MARIKTSATGTFRLLKSVPKHAIIDRLLRNDENAAAIKKTLGLTKRSQEIRAALFALSINELTNVFQNKVKLTEADARTLHEEWRYRGMKSMYLYRVVGEKPNFSELLDELNRALEEARSHVPDTTEFAETDLRSLEFRSIEEFSGGALRLSELQYSFVAHVSVISPQDEQPNDVEDLRSGFVWLCQNGNWLAICAREIAVRDWLGRAISAATRFVLTPLKFSKDIINQLENDTHVRRRALIDPKTHIARKWTGRQLGKDHRAMQEMSARKNSDDAPFSGYDVDVDDHTSMVLSYNNRQGKIYFSRDLTVKQIRAWAPKKISEIVGAVTAQMTKMASFAAIVVDKHLSRILKPQRLAASEIAIALAICKADQLSETVLPHDAKYYANELGSQVVSTLYVLSDQDEDIAQPCCSSCQSESLRLSKDSTKVSCSACGSIVDLRRVATISGERIRVRDLAEIIQLTPSSNLLECVLDAASTISKLPANKDEESFVIRGSLLVYAKSTENVVLTVDQVPELKSLIERTVPSSRKIDIKNSLPLFKEKCNKMLTVACRGCVSSRVGDKCYLRLFGLIDKNFTPQPHGGQEYGDYSTSITVNGVRQRNLAVVMKSMPTGNSPISSSSSTGREIFEQSVRYMQDPDKQVIGISVPRQLHENLKGMLRTCARQNGKHLVYLDEPELSRVIYTAMKRNRLSINEL